MIRWVSNLLDETTETESKVTIGAARQEKIMSLVLQTYLLLPSSYLPGELSVCRDHGALLLDTSHDPGIGGELASGSFLAKLHFRRPVATQEARGVVETYLFERDLARVARLLRTVRLFKAHLRDVDRSGATHVD